MVDPGDIDVVKGGESIMSRDFPKIRWDSPCFHTDEGAIVGIDPGDIDVDEPLGVSDTPYMNLRLYEMIADSFGVPPAAIDINHCSLEEWAARVDALVREVI
jgi:hypothetical protein